MKHIKQYKREYSRKHRQSIAYKKYRSSIRGICVAACHNTKIRSNRKGIKFNLDSDYIESIFPKDQICPILKVKLSVSKRQQDKYSPSLHRIDSSKGYIKGNVIWICDLANRMFSNANKKELKLFRNYLNNNL